MTHDPTFWIISRAAGFTSLGMLATTMVLGIVLRARPFQRLKPAQVMEVHRFVSLLGILALGVHGVSLLLDKTVQLSPLDLVVPGIAPYRPLWTGIGVVAGELMILLHLSFRYRNRIGVRVWRRMHWAAYGTIVGGALHGLLAGSDSNRPFVLGLYAVLLVMVATPLAWRIMPVKRTPARKPAQAAAS